MFCNKCGSQIPDGAPFCQNCGAPMQPTQPTQPVQYAQPVQYTQQAPVPAEKPKKKVNPLAIVLPIIAVVLVAAIVLTIVFWPDKSSKTDDKSGSGTNTEESVESQETTTKKEDEYFISKTVYVYYDEYGNVESKSTYEYFSEDADEYSYKYEDDGEIYSQRLVERDDQGRITKITTEYYGGKTVMRFSDYKEENGIYVATAKYEADGQIIEKKLGYKDGVKVLEEEIHDENLYHTFEKSGNTETEKYYDCGVLVETYTTEYDKNGNAIRYEYKSDTDYTSDYVTTYKYDKNGNILEGERIDYEGNVTNRIECEYDKNGNNTSKIYYEEGNVTEKYTAKYNKYDICIEYEIRDENDEIVSYAKLREESNNKVIVDHYDENDIVEYYYEYTITDGKLTEEKCYDGKTENLQSVTKYNEYGLREEARGYNDEGKLSYKDTYEYTKKA